MYQIERCPVVIFPQLTLYVDVDADGQRMLIAEDDKQSKALSRMHWGRRSKHIDALMYRIERYRAVIFPQLTLFVDVNADGQRMLIAEDDKQRNALSRTHWGRRSKHIDANFELKLTKYILW